MLALQREAEAAGLWQTTETPYGARATNPTTSRFLSCAKADFSEHHFYDAVCFDDSEFPGQANFAGIIVGPDEFGIARFRGSNFHGLANFEFASFHGGADFSEATFKAPLILSNAQAGGNIRLGRSTLYGNAALTNTLFAKGLELDAATLHGHFIAEGAQILDVATFEQAKFCKSAQFFKAIIGMGFFGKSDFHGVADFNGAEFLHHHTFDSATFKARSTFIGTIFQHGVDFSGARFDEVANFSCASFSERGNSSASFLRTIFQGPAVFDGARFGATAVFTSIHSKVAFSLAEAKFRRTPDFIEATFHQAPRLDDCELVDPISESQLFKGPGDVEALPSDPRPSGLLRCFALARDKHEHARLRKLRAMAADGKDHENEILFNAHEIAARRFWVDKPSSARFWLGWLYGLVSGYGRSIARPLVAWALVIMLFWGIFFFTTTDLPKLGHGEHCHLSYEATLQPEELGDQRNRVFGGPAGQSLALALRNAIVLDRSEPATSRRMFGCLYGMTGKDASALPVIPPAVNLLSALQSVLSAVLLFLAGLGIRNMFRMKGS